METDIFGQKHSCVHRERVYIVICIISPGGGKLRKTQVVNQHHLKAQEDSSLHPCSTVCRPMEL